MLTTCCAYEYRRITSNYLRSTIKAAHFNIRKSTPEWTILHKKDDLHGQLFNDPKRQLLPLAMSPLVAAAIKQPIQTISTVFSKC